MDKLRDFLKSWPGRILLILCLSPLALLGIESYFYGSVDPNQVAQVGESSISLNQYQTALNARRNEILEQIPDASLLNETVLQEQVLNGLIDRALLEQQVKKLGMTVSDETINRLLRQEDVFKDASGNFSNERFATFLRQRGMTKNQLFAEFRNQLSLDQLNASIVGTAIYPMAAIDELIDLQLESRQIWLHRINWQAYQDNVSITEQDIEDYYNTHKDSLKSKAMVNLSYIELSPSSIAEPEITEADIEQQYAAYKQNNNLSDERELAQILLTGTDAKEKAAQIQARLDKGESFAKLAKEFSDDPTGQQGGVLGRYDAAVFAEDAPIVEQAIAGLEVGEVSEPVQTSFGYQIFTVLSNDGEAIPSMESMREQLIAQAKEYKRQIIYADKVTAINELATDGFSITDIAQQENLPIKTIKDYTKEDNTSVLSQPAVIKQAFDEFIIQDQAVTAGIEVADGTVWVQPSDYRPIQTLSLSAATPEITQQLRQQQASALALQQAQQLAENIHSTADIETQPVSFMNLGQVNRQSVELNDQERSVAFSQSAPADGVVTMVTQTPQGATVMVAGAIETQSQPQLSDSQKAQTAAIVRDNLGQNQLQDYLEYLRLVYEVNINEANLANAQ